MAIIRFKRGPKERLPESALLGEPIFTTDTNELFIGNGPNSPIKKIVTQVKDINIICSAPVGGIHHQYIKFPYSGTIKSVDAYCGMTSEHTTEIDIQKISEDGFRGIEETPEPDLEEDLMEPGDYKQKQDDGQKEDLEEPQDSEDQDASEEEIGPEEAEVWTTVLSSNVVIEPNHYAHNEEYEVLNSDVNKNDLFRLVFVQADGILNLTVQIQIEINS